MSTDLKTRPQGPSTDHDDDDYHHHTKGATTYESRKGVLEAWCGVRRPAKPNPLAYPCCPECARLMDGDCISKEWS